MNTLDLIVLLVAGWALVTLLLTAALVVGRTIEHVAVLRRRERNARLAETASARYLARLRDAGLL